MNDKDFDLLIEFCDFFEAKSMQERAEAAKEATALIRENGMTWAELLGKNKESARPLEFESREHRYNGFIPFASELQSTYDEARGYSMLLANKDERPALTKIMQRDLKLRELDDGQYKLVMHLRDEARELRDLLVPEVFELRSGRKCRVVSNRP